MATIRNKAQLSDDDICELEAIHNILAKSLVKADQQCCPLSNSPLLATVQMAYLVHC